MKKILSYIVVICMIITMVPVEAMASGGTEQYCDADGKVLTANNVQTIDSSTTVLKDGWYVAKGNISITHRVKVEGDVNLILADNCVMDALKGITLTGYNKLTVWGQEKNNGRLNSEVDIYNANDLSIGCELINEKYNSQFGQFTLNGGEVRANGGCNYGVGEPFYYDNPSQEKGLSTINIYGGYFMSQVAGANNVAIDGDCIVEGYMTDTDAEGDARDVTPKRGFYRYKMYGNSMIKNNFEIPARMNMIGPDSVPLKIKEGCYVRVTNELYAPKGIEAKSKSRIKVFMDLDYNGQKVTQPFKDGIGFYTYNSKLPTLKNGMKWKDKSGHVYERVPLYAVSLKAGAKANRKPPLKVPKFESVKVAKVRKGIYSRYMDEYVIECKLPEGENVEDYVGLARGFLTCDKPNNGGFGTKGLVLADVYSHGNKLFAAVSVDDELVNGETYNLWVEFGTEMRDYTLVDLNATLTVDDDAIPNLDEPNNPDPNPNPEPEPPVVPDNPDPNPNPEPEPPVVPDNPDQNPNPEPEPPVVPDNPDPNPDPNPNPPIDLEMVKNIRVRGDNGLFKIFFGKVSREADGYRVAICQSGTDRWIYKDVAKNRCVVKNLYNKSLIKNGKYLFKVAARKGNVCGEYSPVKTVWANRLATRSFKMADPKIASIKYGVGATTVVVNKIRIDNLPNDIEYKVLYRLKGASTWQETQYGTNNVKYIKGLKKGKTYNFAAQYRYYSDVDCSVRVYSTRVYGPGIVLK